LLRLCFFFSGLIFVEKVDLQDSDSSSDEQQSFDMTVEEREQQDNRGTEEDDYDAPETTYSPPKTSTSGLLKHGKDIVLACPCFYLVTL